MRTLKHYLGLAGFSETCKKQIPRFSKTQNAFSMIFHDTLQAYVQAYKHAYTRSKSSRTKPAAVFDVTALYRMSPLNKCGVQEQSPWSTEIDIIEIFALTSLMAKSPYFLHFCRCRKCQKVKFSKLLLQNSRLCQIFPKRQPMLFPGFWHFAARKSQHSNFRIFDPRSVRILV